MGITGKGVKIAIIDSPLNTGHSEFKNNLVHYETISKSNSPASFHGAAVASIATGKQSGIAPDADLVYFGAQFAQKQTVYDSLKKVLEMNEKLPDNEKIQVLSMSNGFFGNDIETAQIKELVKKLSDSGVLVLSSDMMKTQGLPFGTLNKIDPMGDPDDFNNYIGTQDGITSDFENPERTLYVNAGDRTVATATNNKSFRHDSASSTSWTLPYIAGVYACAKQVNPKITKEEFWDKAQKTGVPTFDENNTRIGTIIDASALMKCLSEN